MPPPLRTGAHVALAELDHLTYWYPQALEPAVRDVTISIDGGLTVVAGPSGGGKSSLLRVFNGLVPHFHGGRISGRASVAGLSILDTPTRLLACTVGFVFQDPELQTVYSTVDREVAFGLENIALPAARIPARVEEALQGAGVAHLAGRAMRTLSGGERQRVALASALAMRPNLLVLDEPTSQLDPEGAALILAGVHEVTRQGRAVVISEHRLDRLVPAADRLLIVENGDVDPVDPQAWRPPPPAPRPPRRSELGAEAWHVSAASVQLGGHLVLDGVDLAGRSSEVVALMGPNGGGKTTLIRLIAGLLTPMGGASRRRPGRIAYLPQNPAALLHRPTLRQEVQLTIDLSGEHGRPETILTRLGLRAAAERYPRDLSSGERQRAALAAILPGTPELVLLDEPTRGMDGAARDVLIGLIADLRDRGSAIVIATHDADLRGAVADRVVRVAEGKAVELVRQAVAQ